MRHCTLFFYLIVGPCLTATLLGNSIEIPDQVSVTKERLLLGEIARIEGDPGAFNEVSLGYAPYPGHHRWLSRSDVERALSRAGMKNVQISMNDRILVTRESQTLGDRRIEQVVQSFLESLQGNLEFRVLELELPQEIILPDGDVRISVGSPAELSRLDGVSLRLDFFVNEKRVKSQWVRVRGTARGPVVVAARDLAYGEKVSASDVDVTERELTDLEAFVFNVDQVVGMSARRPLRAGELIATEDVKRPTMVKRGEVVRVIARGKRFAVATLAKARAAGQQGDFILLENLDSKEVVRARVIGQNLVEIDVLEVMQ